MRIGGSKGDRFRFCANLKTGIRFEISYGEQSWKSPVLFILALLRISFDCLKIVLGSLCSASPDNRQLCDALSPVTGTQVYINSRPFSSGQSLSRASAACQD